MGYFRDQRAEGFTDPNRDFPYDILDPKLCMQTITGRTVNEIYRDHLFQLSLTFHAGMEIVSYEWGAPTWGTYVVNYNEYFLKTVHSHHFIYTVQPCNEYTKHLSYFDQSIQ